MPAFSLVYTPQHFTDAASPHTRRSPTPPPAHFLEVIVSAVCFGPATLSALDLLTTGLLRTLSRMAASKPPSWLSQQLDILCLQARAEGPLLIVCAVFRSTM